MTEVPIYVRLLASVDAAVAIASATLTMMPDDQFSQEHRDVHAIDNTPAIELIANAFEHEYWRRWPAGKSEDAWSEASATAAT